MKQLLTTVAASTAVIFTLAITAMPAAQAGEYSMTAPDGIASWGFKTLESCQASASGLGGTCALNSSVTAPADAYAYSPKSVRHHRK